MESLPNFPIYRHGPSATSGLIRRRNLGGLTLLSRFWRSWRRIHRLRSTPTSGESTVSSLRISKHKTEKTPLLANTLASAAALPACNVVSGIWMVTLALSYSTCWKTTSFPHPWGVRRDLNFWAWLQGYRFDEHSRFDLGGVPHQHVGFQRIIPGIISQVLVNHLHSWVHFLSTVVNPSWFISSIAMKFSSNKWIP